MAGNHEVVGHLAIGHGHLEVGCPWNLERPAVDEDVSEVIVFLEQLEALLFDGLFLGLGQRTAVGLLDQVQDAGREHGVQVPFLMDARQPLVIEDKNHLCFHKGVGMGLRRDRHEQNEKQQQERKPSDDLSCRHGSALGYPEPGVKKTRHRSGRGSASAFFRHNTQPCPDSC